MVVVMLMKMKITVIEWLKYNTMIHDDDDDDDINKKLRHHSCKIPLHPWNSLMVYSNVNKYTMKRN